MFSQYVGYHHRVCGNCNNAVLIYTTQYVLHMLLYFVEEKVYISESPC